MFFQLDHSLYPQKFDHKFHSSFGFKHLSEMITSCFRTLVFCIIISHTQSNTSRTACWTEDHTNFINPAPEFHKHDSNYTLEHYNNGIFSSSLDFSYIFYKSFFTFLTNILFKYWNSYVSHFL